MFAGLLTGGWAERHGTARDTRQGTRDTGTRRGLRLDWRLAQGGFINKDRTITGREWRGRGRGRGGGGGAAQDLRRTCAQDVAPELLTASERARPARPACKGSVLCYVVFALVPRTVIIR